MTNSEPPRTSRPEVDVPDLDLEPVIGSARRGATEIAASKAAGSAPNLFEDEAFMTGNSPLELELDAAERPARDWSPTRDAGANVNADAWPSGVAPERNRLTIDSVELALLAGYGAAPTSPQLTPSYAYRVFVRRRELKRALAALDAEYARAEIERETALGALAARVLPELEQREQFELLLSPLRELGRTAGEREEALFSLNRELNQRASALEAEREQITAQLAGELTRERGAQAEQDRRADAAKRASAKLQRVRIEIRALMQVAEQKLGPHGGAIPEPEASQLAELRARSETLEPEVARAEAELERARAARGEAATRVASARRNERLAERKKLALVQHYRAELDLRGRSLNQTAEQRRTALSALGRALLAAPAGLQPPAASLARVRAAGERADALLLRCEMHLRALDAYDRPRAAQGVKLALTLIGMLALLAIARIVL